MLEVTVKTLDGTNRSYSVPEDITVKHFKEKIAGSNGISADSQRLIFQGRVLQDEKKLNDYDVNGKTLHVVQRPPPGSRSQTTNVSTSNTSTPPGGGASRTFTMPSDAVDTNQIQNIVSQVLSGMGDVGRNAQVSTSSSGDGSSVDVHINLGQIGVAQVNSESQNRIRTLRRLLRMARQTLDRLDNPPGTEGEEAEAMDTTPSEETTPENDSEVLPSEPVTNQAEPSIPNNASTASTADSSEGGSANVSTAEAPRDNNTTGTATSETPNQGTTGQNANPTRGPQHPRLTVLAELLQEVSDLNGRFQPHFDRYQQFLREDPSFEGNAEEVQAAQQRCNRVSEVMHYISHAYHCISDLMVDTRQAVPRVLTATPVAFPAAIIQQTIPVQAQINVAHVSPRESPHLPRRSAASSTATTTPASATTTTTAPQPQAQQARLPLHGTWPLGGFPPRFPPGTQVHIGGAPRMGGAAFGPGGTGPVMFMELGPNGVSVNSVSAQVVTGGSTASTNSSTSTNAGAGTQPAPGAVPGGFPGGLPGGIPGAIPAGIPGQGMNFLPPNIIQNIVQMAQQAAMGGQPAGQQVIVISEDHTINMPVSNTGPTTAQAGSSTTTSPSSATTQPSPRVSTRHATSSSTAGTAPPGSIPAGRFPGFPRGVAFPFPGGPRGMLPPPGFGMSVDPYLACQSRFFLRRRAAAAAAAGTNTTTTDSNAAQRQEHGVAGMVSNLVSSLLQGGAPPTMMSTSQAPPSQTTSAGGTAAQGPNTAPNADSQRTSAQTDPPAILQLRNLLQSANQTQSSGQNVSQSESSTSTSTSQSAPRAANAPIGDDMFAELVRGIGTYVSQAAMGQRTSDSIFDFVNNLGQEIGGSEEGLLTEIFACVSHHLTIMDLMAVFCNQTAPLQRLLQPLQQFVRERVLQGEEATPQNFDSATERLVEEMLPQIEEICTDAPVRDNIDYPASVQELMRHHLRVNSQFILNTADGDLNFSNSLYNNIRSLIHEFMVLSQGCLQGGRQAVEAMVQANVRRMSLDVNPMIQQWMSSMTSQQIQTTLRNISVTDEQIQQYIVRQAEQNTKKSVAPKSAPEGSPQSQSSEASFMSAESGDNVRGAAGINGVTEVMGCEDAEAAVMETMDVDSNSIPSPLRSRNDRHPHIDPAILARLPPPPHNDRDVPEVVGSESWHSQVPADWVPVITRDMHTQRHQQPQNPFSDAYMNGMPAKRRKLMTKSSDNKDIPEVTTLIPQAIENAAKAVGAEPITSFDDMSRDATGSSSLRQAFQREMDESIRKRLDTDDDYIAEKYPNTDQYYKKKE